MPSKVKFDRPAKAPKCHVRAGDRVILLTGPKERRGKTGTVIKVFPFEQRALVEGECAASDTRHVKANPQANKQGGRIQKLRPIHLSNLALIDPGTGKATRVRRDRTADGVVRVGKKGGHKFQVQTATRQAEQ